MDPCELGQVRGQWAVLLFVYMRLRKLHKISFRIFKGRNNVPPTSKNSLPCVERVHYIFANQAIVIITQLTRLVGRGSVHLIHPYLQ